MFNIRLLFVFLLAVCLVPGVPADDSPAERKCDNPGGTFFDGCNTCGCSSEGTVTYCTFKYCAPDSLIKAD